MYLKTCFSELAVRINDYQRGLEVIDPKKRLPLPKVFVQPFPHAANNPRDAPVYDRPNEESTFGSYNSSMAIARYPLVLREPYVSVALS